MSKLQKLAQKILEGRDVSYDEAEGLLLKMGFQLEVRGSHHIFRKKGFQLGVRGSHHIFRKKGYVRNLSIKRRSQLLPYQIADLKEVLRDHGY